MTNWYDDIVSAIVGAINAIFLKKNDIADNLTTNDASKVLSAKQGKNLQDNKQANLVSGTNIKTVNNESLLGSGNITIQGGSNVDVVTSWESTLSDSKVPSEKLTKNTIDGKVDKETGKGLFSGSYNDLTNKPIIPEAYVHPSSKQCNYAYTHPSEKQCNATIPSASSSTPSADVTGGAIGSSSNYAKADHQHPLSSAYATANHNQNLSTINNVTTMAVLITYTDDTTETKNLVIYNSVGQLVVNVFNSRNSPLSNATILLDNVSQGTTNSNGQITLNNVNFGSHIITASYNGSSNNVTKTVDKLNDSVTIILNVN